MKPKVSQSCKPLGAELIYFPQAPDVCQKIILPSPWLVSNKWTLKSKLFILKKSQRNTPPNEAPSIFNMKGGSKKKKEKQLPFCIVKVFDKWQRWRSTMKLETSDPRAQQWLIHDPCCIFFPWIGESWWHAAWNMVYTSFLGTGPIVIIHWVKKSYLFLRIMLFSAEFGKKSHTSLY